MSFYMDVVFGKLYQTNLKLNPDKCYFEKDQIEFLKHEIFSRGITPTTTKVAAINASYLALNAVLFQSGTNRLEGVVEYAS
ncbi:9723_t:CDS:2 [Cetraspora pellucida]|uniref:9723_t:CDS:1 n=1 Tax=Cetraspora pellucida TaxID=1433469 RepID=A0A9N9EHP9_9GLOM|nr:9723_t:CDS:2 [Cetraspora pellucida]